MGGNGSGTPDALVQLGDLVYEFLFGDIETLFDPNGRPWYTPEEE
ncbi:hypothetical protein [Ureibacillus sp. FSL E2-3493]